MPKTIVVPVQAVALVRPILDEVQKGAEHDERRLSNLLYGLTQKRGRAADEALVVLMCFYVGESQEEADAVIARGNVPTEYANPRNHNLAPRIAAWDTSLPLYVTIYG